MPETDLPPGMTAERAAEIRQEIRQEQATLIARAYLGDDPAAIARLAGQEPAAQELAAPAEPAAYVFGSGQVPTIEQTQRMSRRQLELLDQELGEGWEAKSQRAAAWQEAEAAQEAALAEQAAEREHQDRLATEPAYLADYQQKEAARKLVQGVVSLGEWEIVAAAAAAGPALTEALQAAPDWHRERIAGVIGRLYRDEPRPGHLGGKSVPGMEGRYSLRREA